MNNFKLTPLSELVNRVKVGFVGSINNFYCEKEKGIPLIRTTDISENGIDYSNLKYVTKEFHQKNKKSQIKKGDIIIARHGENGKANVFKEDFDAQVLNAVIIEPNQNKLESNLLKFFFDSPFIKKQILGVVKGSVQGVINTSHIADLLIPINPNINYKGLSKNISDLNAKIDLNNKINAELEAMAKTLYDYWFVQFDFPDDNGKPYKSSGGKMVWNEALKRDIPEGWGATKLENLGNFKNGVNYDPSNPGDIACPIINVRNIRVYPHKIRFVTY
ncbi:MAG: restriction endonuclease subunit S [Flavobacterium sp.]|nr:restriction endonuclease subunit S [Flavobacterium sp.]